MWQPISASELEAIVAHQLSSCSSSQRAAFDQYRVLPYRVHIHRLGMLEEVYVVAHPPSGLLYFEDIEEGFEIGTLGSDGALVSECANQYELCHLLRVTEQN
jgi:hypothetical protein